MASHSGVLPSPFGSSAGVVPAAPPRVFSEAARTSDLRKEDEAVSRPAVARNEERDHLANIPKDNWLGFVGDVMQFSGEVRFKSMLRIDGNFSGRVNSPEGTLIVSAGAQDTEAAIEVAVAKINGAVEGDIHASK